MFEMNWDVFSDKKKHNIFRFLLVAKVCIVSTGTFARKNLQLFCFPKNMLFTVMPTKSERDVMLC